MSLRILLQLLRYVFSGIVPILDAIIKTTTNQKGKNNVRSPRCQTCQSDGVLFIKDQTGPESIPADHPLAYEFNLAFIEETIKAGVYLFTINEIPGAEELLYTYASDKQLDFIMPVHTLLYETFDARMVVEAHSNTRSLAGVDPDRIARYRKTHAPLFKTFIDRLDKKQMRWCLTVYPTQAMAQEANMSLNDYREFVYAAGMLNENDPITYWKKEAQKQQKLINWLKGHKHATFKGENIDLTLSIKRRKFIPCAGEQNFPDGEIFTSPVEDSVNGWVRFKYPAIFEGQEAEDIELWFEKGKIVKEKAAKNQDLLTAQHNTDKDARYLGE